MALFTLCSLTTGTKIVAVLNLVREKEKLKLVGR